MLPSILALDLSLRRTGYCADGRCGSLTPKTAGAERLAYLRGAIAELAANAKLAVLEGYAFGAKGNAIYQIGELGGVVRLLLHDIGVPFVEVAPTALKKYTVGRGNADKDSVLECAIRAFRFPGHGNDEADAWMLWTMARAHYLDCEDSAARRKVLGGIAWPTLSSESQRGRSTTTTTRRAVRETTRSSLT